MKAFKYLAVGVLVVVVLVAAAITSLALVDFNRYKGVIEKQVSAATGREFRIAGDSELSVSLVPGIVLRDVSLANASWGSEPQMVQVGEAELQVALIPLLGGRIEVRKLVLTDPVILLETDAEAARNWAMGDDVAPAHPGDTGEDGVGIDVALYEVRLENVRFLYRDGVSKRETALDVEEMTIVRNDSEQLTWKASAVLNEIPVLIDGTTSYLSDLLNNRPFQSEMTGTIGNVKFTMTETVSEPVGALDLDVKATVDAPDLETISRLVGTGLPAISPVRLEGEISDAGDAYQVRLGGDAADIKLALGGLVGKTLDGAGMDIDYSVEAPDLRTAALIAGTELPEIGPVKLSGKASEAEGFYRLTAKGSLADLGLDAQGRIARSFEPEGMTATAKVEAPNFETVSKLAKTDIPDVGPLSVKAELTEAGKVYEVSLDGTAGEVHLVTDGTVADSLDGKGIDLNVALKAPDLKVLGELGGTELPPVGPIDVKARLVDIEGGYKVSGLQATAGNSDLKGEAAVAYETKPVGVSVKLASDRLDLSPFEKEQPAKKETEESTPEKTESMEKGSNDRVFSDAPLPFDKLKTVDADVAFDAKWLEMRNRDLKDVVVRLKLEGGRLDVQPLKAQTGNGFVKGDIMVDASIPKPTLDIKLDATGVVLGDIKGLKDVITGGRTKATVDLAGAGNSVREIMAGLNGKVVVDVGKGEMDNNAINLIGADIIVQFLGAINPLGEKTTKAPMDCAVVNFSIEDGVATTDKGIVLETDKMFVIGNGQIDLDSEKIDIAIRTQGREALGVNVGDVTKMMGVGGTLAHPTPALDVEGTAAAGATVGAAVMTLGLSYAAQKALETAVKDRTPCLTALGRAPKPEEGKAEEGKPEKENTELPPGSRTGQ
ncbi:MAG: AsmA family protein [Pseudomonadota bacterium]|nr:AsmA family protein [Pseudomonadota bacterium]